jgi:hypothetical protein
VQRTLSLLGELAAAADGTPHPASDSPSSEVAQVRSVARRAGRDNELGGGSEPPDPSTSRDPVANKRRAP